MSDTGIGADPIGETPAGVGYVEHATPYQSPGYCRAVDPTRGDYVQMADGEVAQTHATRQRIVLSLATELGSAVDGGFGLSVPPTLGDRTARTVEARVRRALAHLTDGPKPAARLTSVLVEQVSQARVRIHVSFVDLLADAQIREEESVSYG
jgi:hypothetical protein